MQMGKTDFKKYHTQSVKEIEKELQTFSKKWHTKNDKYSPELQTINKRFTDSFFGGKILRGTLVRLGYDLTQTPTTKAIYKPAAAFEILHTGLLIHDDIMDQSPIRRSKPAMHIDKNSEYGIAQAICLGDFGLTLATQLLMESDFPTEIKNHALSFFLQIKTDTILGQMLDIQSLHMPVSEEMVIKIHLMKTAHYTIVGPMSIGAILGGATTKLLHAIKRFGEPLGIAYQIQDDILGIFGNEKTLGKSITSDIEEKKSTLLLTYSLEHATLAQKTMLEKYYGKKNITKKEHIAIQEIYQETGAVEYSQKKIKELTTQAKKVIPLLSQDLDMQDLVTQFVDILVKRIKTMLLPDRGDEEIDV